MILGRAAELARFSPESFTATPLFKGDQAMALLVALEPGQQIPVHAPAVNLVVTVADGTGDLLAGTDVHPLRVGDVAVVPAGETRSIRARTERLVLVNFVTPLPGSGDHAPTSGGWPDEADTGAGPS
jgi:quercetin dioxygenase-like cupin family protein